MKFLISCKYQQKRFSVVFSVRNKLQRAENSGARTQEH